MSAWRLDGGPGQPLAKDVIVPCPADWRGWEETVHLLSSSANAARLRAAVAELDAARDGTAASRLLRPACGI